MQLKSITAITVLLLVITSMSVCGCTTLPGFSGSSSGGSVSTDYPTSGRSKLVEGVVENLRSTYNTGYQNEKQKSFDVNWVSDVWAQVHEERIDTQNYKTYKEDYKIIHYPSTDAATTYFNNNAEKYGTSQSYGDAVIDYYKITGKTPTVYNKFAEYSFSTDSISQFDSLIVERTSA